MKRESDAVTAYIEEAAPFARPILRRLRKAFLAAHPGITEAIKWRFPHFEYKGIVGSMAGFKEHVSWGLWKSALLADEQGLLKGRRGSGLGEKLTDISELPSENVLIDYIREAVRLNEEGVKIARPAKVSSKPVEVPPELAAALTKNKAAKKHFEAMPPSHQREYSEWIAGAKQAATREKRVATAIEWISEGKSQNWKYQK